MVEYFKIPCPLIANMCLFNPFGAGTLETPKEDKGGNTALHNYMEV